MQTITNPVVMRVYARGTIERHDIDGLMQERRNSIA